MLLLMLLFPMLVVCMRILLFGLVPLNVVVVPLHALVEALVAAAAELRLRLLLLSLQLLQMLLLLLMRLAAVVVPVVV